MESFAIYRMPQQTECLMVMGSGAAETVMSVSHIDDDIPAFVIAPFTVSETTPILLIRNRCARHYERPSNIPQNMLRDIDAISASNILIDLAAAPDREDYACDFSFFHSHLTDGTFSKLVLSRRMTAESSVSLSPSGLFVEACRRYPRCFIALFSTPASGTWLVASPELLLEKKGDVFHTMALAGTMEYTGDPDPRWSDKNIREQQYVGDYIRHAISPYADSMVAEGPHTVRAAGLVHLRTDFTFSIDGKYNIGELLQALHPTPAVCGVPAVPAHDFIIANEHSDRAYYSGFCGPVGIEGSTNLYVTLRCMRLRSGACDLFAGGGLLADSNEASEWEETEAKMRTMLNLLEK